MRYAYIGDKRIHIDQYDDSMSNTIVCAEGHSLVAKRGQIRVHHFAHKNATKCSCSDGMTEWHLWWQNRVKDECREVRIKDQNGKLHIADTLIPPSDNKKGYVIEYQHSPMDTDVMRERESFYTGQGYHLIWVFDTHLWEIGITKKNGSGITFRQKKGSSFPMNGAYVGNVTKIYDFGKRDLFVVTKQSGANITGDIISFDEFDNRYTGSYLLPDADTRPFHHSLMKM